jgi:hypothetical protein
MAEPVRIIGHNKDGTLNEQLQAQVETDGSLRTDLLARYRCADLDESGDPKYYGFIDTDGAWYILRYNVASGQIRYAKGASGYTIAWANASGQSYDYYYTTF